MDAAQVDADCATDFWDSEQLMAALEQLLFTPAAADADEEKRRRNPVVEGWQAEEESEGESLRENRKQADLGARDLFYDIAEEQDRRRNPIVEGWQAEEESEDESLRENRKQADLAARDLFYDIPAAVAEVLRPRPSRGAHGGRRGDQLKVLKARRKMLFLTLCIIAGFGEGCIASESDWQCGKLNART